MADQTFAITSGFYDAVDGDRTYSADDMNKPYKRLISNGVFATPYGDPSTDFKVAPYTGLYITVAPGQGIFGDKWVENDATLTITVPANNTILPRMDSVIIQVDLRQSGRVANIVYRTGTPSSNPQPPDIYPPTGVVEYRVANVLVNASASAISAANITDCRGSEECPWITALIKQVDTSDLYRQWQAAYAEYFESSTEEINAYFASREQAFDDFLDQLTQELTVSSNVAVLRSEYVTASELAQIPINLPSYDESTDVLEVFINGFHASPGMDYRLGDGTYITLTAAAPSGQTISFVVFKSLIGSDAASVTSALQTLNDNLSAATGDTGWVDISPLNGAQNYHSLSTMAYRKIGKQIFLKGAFKGVTEKGTIIGTLPVGFRPIQDHTWTTSQITGTTYNRAVIMQVTMAGQIKVLTFSGTMSATASCSIDTSFLVGFNPA